MAPRLIGPAQQRQSSSLRATFQRAVNKAGRGSDSCGAFLSQTHLHEAEQDCALHIFGETLNCNPEDRDRQAVREALDWWLEGLSVSGCELAAELRVPDSVLYEAFKRGKLSTCMRNQLVFEEGEEANHFTLILFGSCKLRCMRPKEDLDKASTNEADGYIVLETLRRGDIFPVFPSDARSDARDRPSYNIICVEKTLLLRLATADYDFIFKQLHRDIFSDTVQFLKQIFPDAMDYHLHKLAPLLRHRRIPRGRTFINAGEYQRHIFFLKSGACAVLMHDSPNGLAGPVPLDEEDRDDGENEVETHDRLLQLRSSSYGARMQQAAAYNAEQRNAAKDMARGPLRQSLDSTHHYAFRVFDEDAHQSASLVEPGMMLGDEAMIYDKLKDWINCRSCYSACATTGCHFWVADVMAYRHIANCLAGTTGLALTVSEKMNRRCKQFARAKKVAKDVNRQVQELKADEVARLNRQKLRLPKCRGRLALEELEDVDDYLGVVMAHRRAPVNESALPTLSVLDGTPYGPRSCKNGPAVAATLKALAEEADGRIPQGSMTSLKEWFEPRSYVNNPMGSVVPDASRYIETAPPRCFQASLALEDTLPTSALTRCASSPQVAGTGGLFSNTEVDFDDGMFLALEEKRMNTSISLPNLSQAHGLASLDASKREDVSTLQKRTSKQSPSGNHSEARAAATKRHQYLMKSFTKAISGKSVLLLTERKDLRKQITSILLKDAASIHFIKKSNDLWSRLRDTREQYHALLIDLTKSETPIETILRIVRQDCRYGKLPIVVLSDDRNLSEMVRTSCNFVVFLPLSAGMLREALVWCFDRASIQKLHKLEDEQVGLQCARVVAEDMHANSSPLPMS